MEPILAVIVACIAYVIIFVLVSWLKDIFTNWREQICGVFMESWRAQRTQEVLTYTDYGNERMIKMIELTNTAYWTLITLSVLAGYAINEIIRSIRKGEFFDWDDDTK